MRKTTGKKLQVKLNNFWYFVFCINQRKEIVITPDPKKALPGDDITVFQSKFANHEFRVFDVEFWGEFFQRRSEMNVNLHRKKFGPAREFEIEELEEIEYYTINEVGSENLYFTASFDGNDYFIKM